jgi:hypothetical protein
MQPLMHSRTTAGADAPRAPERSRALAVLPALAAIFMASSVLAQPVQINNTEANYVGAAAGDWSNPGNVVGTPDNACANMGAVGKVNLTSNFGFTLPTEADITGATAYIKASSPGGQNIGVQLASNATIDPPTLLGSQATLAVFDSASGNCAVTDVTSVGPALAMWGNPVLTPAIVNATSFGLVFTKLETSTVKVDSICLEIDYTTTEGMRDRGKLASTKRSRSTRPPSGSSSRSWAMRRAMTGTSTSTAVRSRLPAAGGFQDFTELDPGSFDISETTKDGYTASVQCFIEDTMVASGGASVTVAVARGRNRRLHLHQRPRS